MRTREEFEAFRQQAAREMSADTALADAARDVLVRADRHHWVHQATWFGQPVLQLPQDLLALQEIIYNTRPRFVIETGVAWGGSLLLYATVMEALGAGHVIGIDTYVPPDLRERLGSYGRLSDRITLIEGSSTDDATLDRVRSLLEGTREVMVVLDSNHTCEHVDQELQRYSGLVGKGQYLVCSDTVVESIPVQTHRPRPWGPGNSPKTALDKFLAGCDRFEVDAALENKLLFSCCPGGYLRCTKD